MSGVNVYNRTVAIQSAVAANPETLARLGHVDWSMITLATVKYMVEWQKDALRNFPLTGSQVAGAHTQ